MGNCLKANIIPHFLKFRIPTNGCFGENSILYFQLRLLKKELFSAKGDWRFTTDKLEESRNELKCKKQVEIIPSIIFHTRYDIRLFRRGIANRLNGKLLRLSNEQDKPLFNVNNTVICYNPIKPPKYVIDTLALSPRNATWLSLIKMIFFRN